MDLSASLEDYLEAIFHIIAEKKVARAKEIARRIKVNQSSVTEAFRSLAQKELINYAPYEVITLTPAGEAAALDIIRRHAALKDFFTKILAVEENIAEEGACRIEHAAPREIIERLIKFVSFMENCPRGGNDLTAHFEQFCSTGRLATNKCQACINECLEKG